MGKADTEDLSQVEQRERADGWVWRLREGKARDALAVDSRASAEEAPFIETRGQERRGRSEGTVLS